LILDEPTNDLDVETMELLEDLLVSFKGTLLLISHDRMFLNNVITSVFVFNKNGQIQDFVGGFEDWMTDTNMPQPQIPPEKKADKKEAFRAQKKAGKKRKHSFKEMQELEALPAKIEALEKQQAEIHEQMAESTIYRLREKVVALKQELEAIEEQLNEAYLRWEKLDSI